MLLALYQCNSAKRIVPSDSLTWAIPLRFRHRPTSVPFSQPANLANRLPNGECLDVRNVADDREVHSAIVPELRRAVNLTSNALAFTRGRHRRTRGRRVQRLIRRQILLRVTDVSAGPGEDHDVAISVPEPALAVVGSGIHMGLLEDLGP